MLVKFDFCTRVAAARRGAGGPYGAQKNKCSWMNKYMMRPDDEDRAKTNLKFSCNFKNGNDLANKERSIGMQLQERQ